MHTRSHRLLAVSLVALFAGLGATATQAKLAVNGTRTHGIWDKLATNGTQTNGDQAGSAAKAPNRVTPVTPQAATVTLPNGTTLTLR